MACPLSRISLAILFLALSGCDRGSRVVPARPSPAGSLLPISVVASALGPSADCSASFVGHFLPHTTQPHGAAVRRFETNGAGLAINDLDGDGWLDVVLANLDGPATLLWNRGGLTFDKATLADHSTRAVSSVDVDGDGWLDIAFTHSTSAVSYWRNAGARSFELRALPGVSNPAYTLAWGDLNGDGALDLVTGSYDAELNLQATQTFLFSDGAGVFYYERHGDAYVPQRLAREAHALALVLLDLNADQQLDILVGNDFDMHDQAWVRHQDGWAAAAPFRQTSHSTMSLDWGDVDNDGAAEIFASDMNPYDIGVDTMALWLPAIAKVDHALPRSDPQRMYNALQVRGEDGRYRNESLQRGVDATGWSWSGKFGDLDQDGSLDLYVVNGMVDSYLFRYLPNGELVEANQALRNLGDGLFARAPEWGLGSTAGGRGMSLGDLDNDGDLDAVVNNLGSPAQLFENQLCGGASLQVALRWPESGNTAALGAQITLHTSAGTYSRDVRAASGYLSGDPARVHFGFPAEAALLRLEVLWPDGAASNVDTPAANTLLTLSR